MKPNLSAVLIAASVAVCAVWAGVAHSEPEKPLAVHMPWKQAGLTENQAAAHLLNRFAFGPRPGEVDAVVKMGLDRWLERQLGGRPPRRQGPGGPARAAGPRHVHRGDLQDLSAGGPRPRPGQARPESSPDDVKKGDLKKKENEEQRAALKDKVVAFAAEQGYRPEKELLGQLMTQKLVRAVESENQLEEVMTDFWYNHFNVSLTDNKARPYPPLLRAGRHPPARPGPLPRPPGGHRQEPGDAGLPRQRPVHGGGGRADHDAGRDGPHAERARSAAAAPAAAATRPPAAGDAAARQNAARSRKRKQQQGRQRELRPRADGAPHPRRRRRLHPEGRRRGGPRLHRLDDPAGAAQGPARRPRRGSPAPSGPAASASTRRGTSSSAPTSTTPPPRPSSARSFPAGRGIEDGEAVLDLLAAHRATARHIADQDRRALRLRSSAAGAGRPAGRRLPEDRRRHPPAGGRHRRVPRVLEPRRRGRQDQVPLRARRLGAAGHRRRRRRSAASSSSGSTAWASRSTPTRRRPAIPTAPRPG